jgi:acyl-coenzyme A synthetase/AMP-(fatty) acid ligase
VEETLLLHPDIYECAVVGERDAEWGENVVAFVTRKDGQDVSPDALDQWCRSQMASFKKPKRYVFCDFLPKNEYGKILKTELRKRLS